MPTDDIMNYAPTLSQELQANKGDKAFDFVYDMFYNLPTGEAVKKDVLLVFDGESSTSAGTYKAWKTKATIILEHFDTVAEKIFFSIKINEIVRGTASVSEGTPSFTPAE
ncbi:MAG: hypothetical protein MJZ20_07715 [Bacteroidaceae bacterium]|nr:hypothetical protein [Bacteroidaceae bacterium]